MKRIITVALGMAVAACSVFASGAVCNHIYEKTSVEATCQDRAHVLNHCTVCGDEYKEYETSSMYPDAPYMAIEGERYGDKLNVRVVMENNPGVWATRLTLYYNANALEPKSQSNGDVWGSSAAINKGDVASDGMSYIRFYETSSTLTDNMNNGTVFSASFEIKGQVEDWKLSLKINYKDVITATGAVVDFQIIDTVSNGYSDHHYDDGEVVAPPSYESEGEIKYSCRDCTVTKTEKLPKLVLGDVNLDGVLDARDCFVVKSYIVGFLGEDAVSGKLDVNDDGAVNAKDLLLMSKLIVQN